MTDQLPTHQQVVLCHWSVQAVAADLGISYDDAVSLMADAYHQGRVQVLGNDWFAGVQVDGRWVVVEGRYQLQQATQEWLDLLAMDRQFTDPDP
jgi:hypothetical protein